MSINLRKKIVNHFIVVLLFGFFLFQTSLRAQTSLLPASARAYGMGNAYGAVANDMDAVVFVGPMAPAT